MRYRITRAVSSAPGEIEITKAEFEATKKAQDSLVAVVSIEEKFDLLIENYREYERSLLDSALHHMIEQHHEHDDFMAERRTVARRLANLLTSTRLYVEQVTKDAARLYGEGSAKATTVKALLRNEYDRTLEYRVMWELRNHVQHQGVFVGGISFPPTGTSTATITLPRCVSESCAARNPRLEAEGYNKDVLKELKAEVAKTKGKTKRKYEGVPLTPLVRRFVELLGEAHDAIRKIVADDAAEWEKQLEKIESQAQSEFKRPPDPLLGLAVVADDEPTFTRSETVYLNRDDIVNYKVSLQRKNSIFVNLSKRYVSSEEE
jgi:hypothetical protein